MSRTTRLFLLAGCALVLFLEVPRTAAALADGWRGPYAGEDVVSAPAEDGVLRGPELARR